MKPSVFVSSQIPIEAVHFLREHCDVSQWENGEPIPRDELIKQSNGKDGILCILTNKIDKEFLDNVVNLKVVSTMSVGYDHIDIKECEKRSIAVGNTPGVLTETTADLALALMLTTSRRIVEGVSAVKEESWGTWQPLWMCGQDLHHSTVGIVGLGRIGAATCRRLKGFGCKILYCGSKPHHEVANSLEADLSVLMNSSKDLILFQCIALLMKTPSTCSTKRLLPK